MLRFVSFIYYNLYERNFGESTVFVGVYSFRRSQHQVESVEAVSKSDPAHKCDVEITESPLFKLF